MLHALRNRFAVYSSLVLLAFGGAANAASVPSNDGTETPEFEVQATGPDGIEVRRYGPAVEAFTTVRADNARAASEKAFMTVAGYIFGNNEGADGASAKIEMTAPVRTTSGTRIDMTAPVKTTGGNTLDEDGSYTIAFIMPSKWTMQTLPKPRDPAVKLREVLAEVRAVLPFKGERGPDEIAALETRLREWSDANGWTVLGAATLAGYDGPSVPSAERRYEVMLPVSKR